ncbi:MAG: hypothetical protein EOO91_08025 [Pedobacter sp.]|nr:MAG: hypothetical protein EOO91_08025 [Pedobacter sp.]
MKKAALLLFIVFASAKLQAQTLDCSKFKEGIFTMEYEGTPITIKRFGNTQGEYVSKAKVATMTFEVKWLDDCTYTLAHDAKTHKKFPKIPDNAMITVKIIKIVGETYYYTSTSNFSEQVVKSKITKTDLY